MTPRTAELKLRESARRRKKSRGPNSLGFTMIEQQAVRVLMRHKRTQALIADLSGLRLDEYKRALESDERLAFMQQLGRDDRLLAHAERLEKIAKKDDHRGQMRAIEMLLKIDGQIGDARARASHTEVNVNINTLGQPQDPRSFAALMRKIDTGREPVLIEHDATGRQPDAPILDPVAAVRAASVARRKERDT